MVQRKDGKITRIVLTRQSDVEMIKDISSTVKSIDGKVDTVIKDHAVLCKQVEINTGVIEEHGKRLTWVERILWTAIGGGTVILIAIKWVIK